MRHAAEVSNSNAAGKSFIGGGAHLAVFAGQLSDNQVKVLMRSPPESTAGTDRD